MILATGSVVVALDTQMRDADGSVGTVEGAVAMVDFGAAWRLLVGTSAEVASFLEIGFLLGGCTWVRADHHLGKLDWRSCRKGGNFVDGSVEAVMVCDLGKVGVPNAVVDRWLQNPAVCSCELLGLVVEDGGWWGRDFSLGNPSIVAGKLTGLIVKGQGRRR